MVAATINTVMAIIRMPKRAQKGGGGQQDWQRADKKLPNLVLNEVVAGPWKTLQLKHRHNLTRACVCPVGSLEIDFPSA